MNVGLLVYKLIYMSVYVYTMQLQSIRRHHQSITTKYTASNIIPKSTTPPTGNYRPSYEKRRLSSTGFRTTIMTS